MQIALSRTKTSLLLVICAGVILTTACDGASTTQPTQHRKLTRADFGFVELGMSMAEIARYVGLPSREVGSGTFVFVYDLDDGSEVILAFGGSTDQLESAILQLPDGQRESLLDALNN